MNQQQFFENLKEALEIEDRELDLTDQFKEYEEWDSLARLSLIAMLDEEYDVILEDAIFNQINTVQELLDAVEQKAD